MEPKSTARMNISDNKKMLSDQDKEISCLKIHNQNLEDEIKKSKNDSKSPYGCDNELDEEIKHLNKLIMKKMLNWHKSG